MARSKQAEPKKHVIKTEPDNVHKDTLAPSSSTTTIIAVPTQAAKKRRWRPGTVALRQIRRLQRSTKLLVPKLPFATIIRAVDKDLHDGVSHRFQQSALDALQEAAESYLDEVFKNSCAISINGKSITLKARDMRCAVQVMKQHIGHGVM